MRDEGLSQIESKMRDEGRKAYLKTREKRAGWENDGVPLIYRARYHEGVALNWRKRCEMGQ